MGASQDDQPLVCRGVRGATTASENTQEAILEATRELLLALMEANAFTTDDLAAAIFTTTVDLNAEFPAVAARQLGWDAVPLLCSHEIPVPGSLPRCIRVLLLVNTRKKPQDIAHIYLREAVNLRGTPPEVPSSR
jgi:chorismate mutase